MKFTHYPLLVILALLLTGCSTAKQASNTKQTSTTSTARDSYESYILTYYPIAVEQMHKHNIPASITLAQGLLESGAGKSQLARSSNNHFGIKADNSWKGKRTSAMDNGRMCYFRKYDNVRESYEDHSKFLANRTRYAFLFKLDKTDYKEWAKGLKQAGYAEDKAYPTKLISLIERYNLDQYDRYSMKDIKKGDGVALENYNTNNHRTIYRANGILYIIGDNGDTFKSLSKETGISKRKLIKYNDLYNDYNIKAGDIIYIEKKNNKATKEHPLHVVKSGESIHSISQTYGIKMKKIFQRNDEIDTNGIHPGDVLKLR